MTLPHHELSRLRAVADSSLDPESTFEMLVERRKAGEPLQYLEGSAPFGPLELVVDSRVLVPRPETEQLWELACRLVEHPAVIVDVGTGSGALALALKHAFGDARVLAVDDSPDALDVARLNAGRLSLEVEWLQGDLFAPLPGDLAGRVDLVVSNPPYVAVAEWEELPTDVRAEPRRALVAGPDGTEVLARIAAEVGGWLAPGGWVVCEIGETQGRWAEAAFAEHLDGVEIRRDLADRDRFVVARQR